jgi:molybdenum cofactor cytidylyltransferase
MAAIIAQNVPVIPAVVLAAGLSSRMGRPKANLLLPDGHTFLSRIVATFLEADIDDVVVVVGHEADAVAAAFRPEAGAGSEAGPTRVRPRFVVNPDYQRGQFSSVLAGLRAIDRRGVAGMLLTLVDVPLVSPATVRAVVAHYKTTRAAIVRPTRGARHGHPVLIDRSVFEDLRRADPAQGAKPVVRAHATPLGDLAIDDDGAFMDVDTPEDYEQIRQA